MKQYYGLIGADILGAIAASEMSKKEVSAIYVDESHLLGPEPLLVEYKAPYDFSKYFTPAVNNRAARRKAKRKK